MTREEALKAAFEAGARDFMSSDKFARPFQEKALPMAFANWLRSQEFEQEGEELVPLRVFRPPPGHKFGRITYAPYNTGDALVFDGTLGNVTVRSCIDCGTLVAGGPTRCGFCANCVGSDGKFLGKRGED